MARKSRTLTPVVVLPQAERIYRTGLYVRLSVLDSGKADSDTVDNQESLLRRFIADKSYFSLVSVYVDNGETGVNFERDEFERLLTDIKDGKIDCVVVKDLSRFGRNYIEAGEYLEKIFPFLGVRFIAVNDGYDSIDPSTSDSLSMHLKNLVNDVYARDISHKITPVLQGKQERGEFIGAWASYGYQKSEEDKHRLVVDDEVAHIVRDIFRWRSDGMSVQNIARKLESLQIPSPSSYRYLRGIVKQERLAHVRWWPDTVKNILTSEVYLGHMVQGRKKESLFHGQKQTALPKDQWIVVRNTHEPIIEQDLFDRVQRITEDAHSAYVKKLGVFEQAIETENILKGLIYCGECGKLLTRYKNVRVNKHKDPKYHIWYSYTCPAHAVYKDVCSFTGIPEKDVNHTVFAVIRAQLLTALDMEKLIQSAKIRTKVLTEKQQIQEKIEQTNDELVHINRLRESLYDDYLDKLMNEHDYLFAQNRYKEKEAALLHRLEELKAEEKTVRETKSKDNPWLQTLLHFRDEPILTRQMAEELVDSVVIHSKTAITVNLRFQEEYRQLQNGLTPLCSEVAAHA